MTGFSKPRCVDEPFSEPFFEAPCTSMSQLLQTLKLKNLSSELSDEEFDEFLLSLRRTKGRELILESLCQQQDSSQTVDMLQIVSNIIRKRESPQQAHIPWTLDTLPKSSIAEIASNLDQSDYASLTRVNRSIYIGCNDPNRLLSVVWKRGSIGFGQYPHLQKLKLSPEASPFTDANDRIFGKLKFLNLHCIRKESDWLSILQPNKLSTPQLQHLTLHCAKFPSSDIIRQLFAKFSMIRHLFLSDIEQNISSRLVAESFPNLQSLRVVRSDPLAKTFLKYRGPDLYQLNLWSLYGVRNQLVSDLKNIKFRKLERLRIYDDVSSEITQPIVETAPNLNTVCYTIRFGEDENKISQFITAILTRKKVSDLYVETFFSKPLDCISKAIEIALQSTRKCERKLFRIGIECHEYDRLLKVNEALVYISRILNRLLSCNIDEFVLFVQLRAIYRMKAHTANLKKDIKDMIDDLGNVELVRSEGCVYIIRTKGSSVNSYKKWWNEGDSDYRVIY